MGAFTARHLYAKEMTFVGDVELASLLVDANMAAIEEHARNGHDRLKGEVLFVIYSDGGVIGISVGDRCPVCCGILGGLVLAKGVFIKGRELTFDDLCGAGSGVGEPVLGVAGPITLSPSSKRYRLTRTRPREETQPSGSTRLTSGIAMRETAPEPRSARTTKFGSAHEPPV
jgi:hypothetical protein